MSDTPFSPWQQRFEKHLAGPQPGPQVVAWLAAGLAPFLRYLEHIGVQSPGAISKAHIEGFRASLLETPWRAKGVVSPAQELFAVRLFLHVLWQTGGIETNPAEAVAPLPARSHPHRRTFGELEAEALLLVPGMLLNTWVPAGEAALARRDQAVLTLLYRLGVSPSELRRLTLAAFTLECGDLYLRPANGTPSRSVRLEQPGVACLQAYIESARPRLVGSGAETALFVTSEGKPLDRAALRDLVQGAAHQAGLHLAVTPSLLYTTGCARRLSLSVRPI